MKFKIAIKYKNYSFEEFLEIEAENIQKAKSKCEEIKQKNQELVERLKNKNVYISKVIEECRLYKTNWRDEFLGCMDIGLPKTSEDNV